VSTATAVTLELDANSVSAFNIDDIFADYSEFTLTPTYVPPRRDLDENKSVDRFIDDFLSSPVPSFTLPD